MLGGFTPMVDSAQSKNNRILQAAAEGLMKKTWCREAAASSSFFEMRLQNNFIFVMYGQPCQ